MLKQDCHLWSWHNFFLPSPPSMCLTLQCILRSVSASVCQQCDVARLPSTVHSPSSLKTTNTMSTVAEVCFYHYFQLHTIFFPCCFQIHSWHFVCPFERNSKAKCLCGLKWLFAWDVMMFIDRAAQKEVVFSDTPEVCLFICIQALLPIPTLWVSKV